MDYVRHVERQHSSNRRIDNAMIDNMSATPEEEEFRTRYAQELRKKKTRSGINCHFGSDELLDELARVNRQAMMTPGRRGEQIKSEEINKEILRRMTAASMTKSTRSAVKI